MIIQKFAKKNISNKWGYKRNYKSIIYSVRIIIVYFGEIALRSVKKILSAYWSL